MKGERVAVDARRASRQNAQGLVPHWISKVKGPNVTNLFPTWDTGNGGTTEKE